jgi:predicted transport protein
MGATQHDQNHRGEDAEQMTDIKLFRFSDTGVAPLPGGAVALERSLQVIFERNLEALLGVRFLASEFATNEGGRMDTIGIDENNSPVIIEYKRDRNENVINQGLYYLNWLMGHRKDFEWLVMERFGKDTANAVDWSGPRLICIAGDFTKYDEHAVQQMDRNIMLIRYRRFEADLLLLEQLTATTAKAVTVTVDSAGTPVKAKYKTVSAQLATAPPELAERYQKLVDQIMTLGDDVQLKTTDFYIAFRRIKNFACVEIRIQAKKLLVFLKVSPDDVVLEDGFTRDVRKIGHFGTGDLEITIMNDHDLDRARPLLERAYQGG